MNASRAVEVREGQQCVTDSHHGGATVLPHWETRDGDTGRPGSRPDR
jgi:hypothetical protein